MKRALQSPAFNAICLSFFTAFYAVIFFITSGHMEFKRTLYYVSAAGNNGRFWPAWANFLASGHHAYIAVGLVTITLTIVALLITRRRPYDEYHISILTTCLTIAIILTLAAVALFYLMILSEPTGVIEKFTLFIVIHWTTVVFADLAYVLLCGWM